MKGADVRGRFGAGENGTGGAEIESHGFLLEAVPKSLGQNVLLVLPELIGK